MHLKAELISTIFITVSYMVKNNQATERQSKSKPTAAPDIKAISHTLKQPSVAYIEIKGLA
jgi:hypothetical protein